MERRPYKKRVDIGSKRAPYKRNQDLTGRHHKENGAIRSFWSNHKMVDIIQLSAKELDIKIEEWLVKYQEEAIKRDKSWWYPTMVYDPKPKKKGPRKINSSFNSSFVNRNMIK